MNSLKAIYSQFLYWLALRLRVAHPVMKGLARPMTKFDLLRTAWSHDIMTVSNRIEADLRAASQAQFEYEQVLSRTMRAVAHNPNRKDPVDPLVY